MINLRSEIGWFHSLFPILLVVLCIAATVPVSTAHAGDRPGPSLDFALGVAQLRTGWGPGLELRPGYAISDKWMVYATFAYAFHMVDPYRSDNAGFVGAGFGYYFREKSKLPILMRAGVVQFEASYRSLLDPPEGPLGFQLGFDIKGTKYIALGAEWTFQANSPQDGILLIPITLTLQW